MDAGMLLGKAAGWMCGGGGDGNSPCWSEGWGGERPEAGTVAVSVQRPWCPWWTVVGNTMSPTPVGKGSPLQGPAVTVALLLCPGLSWASPPASRWYSCSPGRATRSTCAPSTWGAPAPEASPSRSTPQVCAPCHTLSGTHGGHSVADPAQLQYHWKINK